jgi:TetR/AcrR family transcriptional regulator
MCAYSKKMYICHKCLTYMSVLLESIYKILTRNFMAKEKDQTNTEQKILEAAKRIFMENGLEKAKMQDIANQAGISRTALNYYFRTKENLFIVLTDQLFNGILPAIEDLIGKDMPFLEKIGMLVDIYHKQLQENDFIPRFVVVEIQRNPRSVWEFFNTSPRLQGYFALMTSTLRKEMVAGNIKRRSFDEIITVVFGTVFAPYLLTPLLNEFWQGDFSLKKQFFDRHKENTKSVLVEFLKKD